jgi:hypothetical protein
MANESLGEPATFRMTNNRDGDESTVDYPKPAGWGELITRIKAKARMPGFASSRFVLICLGIILIVFNRPLAAILGISPHFSILLGILAFVPSIIPRVSGLMTVRLARVGHYESLEAEAKAELKRAIESIKGTDDLPGLMLANKTQMDAYDALLRSRGESSHRASLVAMAAGLSVVAAGLLIAVLSEDSATKYSVAVMAAVGMATGGYIARTFIRVQQSSQDQMQCYFRQPLVQSYLLAAERIISLMPADVRDDQYKLVLQAALAQAENVSYVKNVTEVDRPTRRKPKRKLPRVSSGAQG